MERARERENKERATRASLPGIIGQLQGSISTKLTTIQHIAAPAGAKCTKIEKVREGKNEDGQKKRKKKDGKQGQGCCAFLSPRQPENNDRIQGDGREKETKHFHWPEYA